MKNKYILLAGLIPLIVILIGMIWGLILKGFTESSDITVIISTSATGVLIVAFLFTIKHILTKIK